jgi:branched-chain amino acid transport system permease protein
MFYKETGQFKSKYKEELAAFPLFEDKIGIGILGVLTFLVIPLFGLPGLNYEFAMGAIMIPCMIFIIMTLGLNILLGFAGQISLGTGAFSGVGAYAFYKFITIFPDINIIIALVLSGLVSAVVGVIFGLPSLRIKGFYLMVATLAAQFFLTWAFIRVAWLYNYNASGAIEGPNKEMFGIIMIGPQSSGMTRYYFVLVTLIVLTWLASNVIRGRIGRSWMMIRDMDIAAELIGIRPLVAKLSAFAFSSFYVGIAGALMVFFWLGAAEAESFDINHSFLYLFMVIIGGLGSITGSYMGAIFVWVVPVLIKEIGKSAFGFDAFVMENFSTILLGAMIITILILEPHGLARLWQITKQKLRLWPFPY